MFATWRIDTRALKAEALLEEPMVAMVPQDHPFAEQTVISLEQLASEPFISLSPLWTQHFGEQTALFRQRGLTRNIVQYAFGPLELLGLVAAGFGVSLHLASFANVRRDGVAYVALEDAPATTVFLLWRRGDDREFVRDFLDTAREVAGSFRDSNARSGIAGAS